MAMELTGEVGRTGRPEDVTIVQMLLANIRGSDGRAFWDRRVDGRPGDDLAAAIEAFQRQWVTSAVAGGSTERGVVRPGSRTWRALRTVLSASLGEPHAVPGSPALRYASWKPGFVASDTAGRLRRADSARERIIAHRLRLDLAGAVEKVAADAGVGLALDRAALVGDRLAMWFAPVGLTVFDGDGRPQSLDRRPGDVPAALWREVDRLMTGRAAIEATGKGGYRPRDGLRSLRDEPDGGLPARFSVDPSPLRTVRRPVLAALSLIARIDRLSAADHDELLQLFDIVAADDPETARVLRERRDAASRGATRQPEAVGAGPSPFEQAVDQLLRAIARNYRSSHMAQLRSLTRNAFDRAKAGPRFEDLVDTGKPWDIKREFPRWVRDPVDGVEYGGDLWGNLHYGYMGKAAGFTEIELWAGAHYQARRSTGRFDDEKDQVAIGAGYALWDQHRFPIPRGALIEALRRRKAKLNTR